MKNEIRIGLEIQAINNGYLVTGHKTDGYAGTDTGKTFFQNFEELSDALTPLVRQSFDLALVEEDEDIFGQGGLAFN